MKTVLLIPKNLFRIVFFLRKFPLLENSMYRVLYKMRNKDYYFHSPDLRYPSYCDWVFDIDLYSFSEIFIEIYPDVRELCQLKVLMYFIKHAVFIERLLKGLFSNTESNLPKCPASSLKAYSVICVCWRKLKNV